MEWIVALEGTHAADLIDLTVNEIRRLIADARPRPSFALVTMAPPASGERPTAMIQKGGHRPHP
ncbi:hypothetical protein AB0M46_01990 [Dactylosporangium sp. NPDC051485]|uniref:hypothetical protein n=1 Tax=Dactylosporangium sp. NPDC051485 TaxID=3154846 RepID=UPI003425BFDC